MKFYVIDQIYIKGSSSELVLVQFVLYMLIKLYFLSQTTPPRLVLLAFDDIYHNSIFCIVHIVCKHFIYIYIYRYPIFPLACVLALSRAIHFCLYISKVSFDA